MELRNMIKQPAKRPQAGHTALELLQKQRSHLLFVLSNAKAGSETAFIEWYQGAYRKAVARIVAVVHGLHYEQHDVDISQGRYPGLPYKYLALYQLSLDGAEAAEEIIREINTLFAQSTTTQTPATWLYYPVSDKVGRAPQHLPALLTIAFANSIPGREREFREWYATRHIRHALSIPALVSGQCFEPTRFQRPGVCPISYDTIAIYEQDGAPEEIIHSFASLPAGALDFPAMDLTRFAEWVYRPLP
jgi:hypothetical protein